MPYAYFPAGERLTRAAEEEYAALRAQDHLRGLPQQEFTMKLATSWALINAGGSILFQKELFASLPLQGSHFS